MKKSKATLVSVLACVFALCMAAMVGCTGQVNSDFVGTYTLDHLSSGSSYITTSDLSDPSDCQLTLGEDGTATIVAGSDTMNGTWKTKSDSSIELTINDNTGEAECDGTTVTLQSTNGTLVFSKDVDTSTSSDGTDTSGTSSTSSGDSASSATSTDTTAPSTSGTVVVDDDICTIVIGDKILEYDEWPGYEITITNKTDRALTFGYSYGTWSVNGKMCDPLLYEKVNAGAYVESTMTWEPEDIASVDELVNVQGTIDVWDSETYDDVASYNITL